MDNGLRKGPELATSTVDATCTKDKPINADFLDAQPKYIFEDLDLVHLRSTRDVCLSSNLCTMARVSTPSAEP